MKEWVELSRNNIVTKCCNGRAAKRLVIYCSDFYWLSCLIMSFSRTEYSGETNEKNVHFLVRTRSMLRVARQRPKRPGLNFANVDYFLQTRKRKTKHLHWLNHVRVFRKKIATTSKKTEGEIVRMG